MIVVWGRKNSLNVQKVMWALGELGLAHERKDAGGAFGGLDTPEYLALNPNGRIPTLVDGDTVVWEPNAVVRYLAAQYGAGSLWPEDPGARARADAWMDWVATTVIPDLNPAFWHLVRLPVDEKDMSVVAAAGGALAKTFAILDAHLADRAFVAGDALTMGDIPVGAAVYRYLSLDLDRPALPHIETYFARLKGRPAFAEHVMIPLS